MQWSGWSWFIGSRWLITYFVPFVTLKSWVVVMGVEGGSELKYVCFNDIYTSPGSSWIAAALKSSNGTFLIAIVMK